MPDFHTSIGHRLEEGFDFRRR
eukprot:COSAG01_NODE_36453_length_517_cov_2.409091_1_plen_21_part_10